MIGRLGRGVRRSGGDWLSRLERAVHIREVTGSNPVSPTISRSPRPAHGRLMGSILSALLVAACAVTPSTSPSPVETQALPAAAIPDFGHIYVIVLENEERESIIGNPAAPYLNELART